MSFSFRSSLAVLLLFCLIVAVFSISRASEAEKTTITNSIGMEFVRIEPGTFLMGSPEDERFRAESEELHKERISEAFYMQTTEVTLGQWWEVMGKKWLFPRKGAENMPVTEVSWYDCQSFINKLNKMEDGEGRYRLPTEAEWEYACRAGTRTTYSWGDEIDCSRAMFANNGFKSDRCIPYIESKGLEPNAPAPVKSYPPNPWGLYDMHGNVWEWSRDCFEGYEEQPLENRFECSRRVRRGGSWYSEAHYARCANRAYAHPAAKFKTTGFRVVKEVP